MLGGLFGGRSNRPMPPPMPPRPQPQYPPGYNPQALQQQSRGGMGFLGTAAAAAAGVAGGMLLGNMLMGALGGGAAQAAGAGGFGTGGADATPAASPWTDPTAGAAPADGGWGQDATAEPQDAYGLEKLASEELAKHYTKDFGIECRIARFHNIYGPFGTWRGGRRR
jgi:hypothetical protein